MRSVFFKNPFGRRTKEFDFFASLSKKDTKDYLNKFFPELFTLSEYVTRIVPWGRSDRSSFNLHSKSTAQFQTEIKIHESEIFFSSFFLEGLFCP